MTAAASSCPVRIFFLDHERFVARLSIPLEVELELAARVARDGGGQLLEFPRPQRVRQGRACQS